MKSLKTKIATVFSFICLALSMAVFGVFSAINIQTDTNGQLGYIDKTCYIQDSSGSRTFYSTIEKAYASATDGDTICVFDNSELTKNLFIEKDITIKAVAASTIDVKTYYISINTQSNVVLGEANAESTLTFTSTEPEEDQTQAFVINNAEDNTLTINDGILISSKTTMNVTNLGTMIVNGGVIKNERVSNGNRSGLYNYNDDEISSQASLTINGGEISGIRAIDNRATLTVNGGEITSTSTSSENSGAIYNSYHNYGEGDTTIKNGLIKGITGIVSFRGSISIQGGEIQADGYGIYSRGSTTTTIIDGTIKSTGSGQQTSHAAVVQASSGILEISGGEVIGENSAHGLSIINCTGKTSITGGTISGKAGITVSLNDTFSGEEILNISQNINKKTTIKGRDNVIYVNTKTNNHIITVNSGELISSGKYSEAISTNSGTLKISGDVTISGYNAVLLSNVATAEISGGTLNGSNSGVFLRGQSPSLVVSGDAKISGQNGIYNESTGILTIRGGSITGTTNSIVLNSDVKTKQLQLSGSPTITGSVSLTASAKTSSDAAIHVVENFTPASPLQLDVNSPVAGQLVVIYDNATWATSDFSHSYGLHTEGDATKIHLGTPIEKPTLGTSSFIYDGTQKTYIPNGYDSEKTNITGNTGTNVNSYTATVSFKTNSANLKYLWSGDYNRNDLPFAWSITKADLSAPTNISWDTDPTHTKATATWTQVENATGYSVELYKDGTSIGTYDTTTTSIDLTDDITAESTYTFTVQAIGDANHNNSTTAISGNLYRLVYMTNYGTNTVHATQYYTQGQTISEPSEPSRTGYNFKGWATTNSATSANLPQTATVSGTYYAVWETVEYTINIDANGGTFSQTSGWTGSGTEISRQVQYEITALGYEDIYKFNSYNSKNTTYDEETGIFTIRVDNTGGTGDKYCNWFSKPINGIVTGATYTYVLEILTWETNGTPVVNIGQTASTQPTQLVEYRQKSIAEPGVYIFTFTGDGSVTNMFSRDFIAIIKGVSIDATFKVSVFPGVVSEEDYEAYKAGSLDSARLPIPTREGYTFNGYFTQANGGEQIVDMYGAVLGDGTIFTNEHIFNNIGNVTLYAQWTINKYTINIDANGGTWAGENSYNANYGSSIEFTTNPTREGYEFEGWYQKNQNGYWAYSNILDPLTAQPFKDVSIGGISQNTDVTSDNENPKVYIPSRNNVSTSEKASKIEKISYTDNDSNPLKTVQASTYYRVTTTKYPIDGDLAYGCYSNTIYARPGYTYYVVIVARFAPGWNISFGANSFGVFESTWISSQAGTGEWETYIFKISIDDSRDKLMDHGYTYLQKQEGANVVSQGTTFDFAYQQIYVSLGKDTQDIDTKFVLLGNETLVARWVSLDNTITLTTNNTKGNYTISSSNLFDKTLVCELNKGYALKVSSGTYSWNGLASVIVDENKFISTWIPIYPGAKYKITGASGNVEFRYGNNLISDVRSQGIAYTSAQEIIVPTKYYSNSTTQTDTQYRWFRFDAPLSALNNIYVEMIDTTITGNSTIILPTGATLSISASADTGYTASINKVSGSGTYSNGELSDIKGNAKLDIMFNPNTNTEYKVEHYQEKIDIATPSESNASDWTLAESESKTGTTDESITPEVKTYTGFTSPSAKTTTISADGSTVVKYYYTRNTYRVTLEYGTGISSVTGGGTFDYDKKITVTAKLSSGYTFSGWTSSTDLVADSSDISYTFEVPADDVTLTASASVNSYTVTYNVTENGGTSGGTTAKVNYGSAVDLSKTATKSGWTFVGWNTSSTATKKLSSYTMPANNVTLYAIFSKTITASFYQLNSTSSTDVTKTIYNKTTSVSITAPEITAQDELTIVGWGNSTSATTSSLASGATTSLSDNATYYAVYKYTVTLSYNGNTSTGGTTSSSSGTAYKTANGTTTPKTTGVEFTLAQNDFTKTGYTFSKWAQGSASGTQYSAGAKVTLTSSATFYAIWTLDTYTITFETNSGEWANGYTAPTSYNINSGEITLPTADNIYRTNYIFAGWYKSPDFSGNPVTSIPAGSTGNKTYYARWIAAAVYNTTRNLGYIDLTTAIRDADSTGDVNTLVVVQNLRSVGTYTVNKSLTILANSAVTVSGQIDVINGTLTLGGGSGTLLITNTVTLNGGNLNVTNGTSIINDNGYGISCNYNKKKAETLVISGGKIFGSTAAIYNAGASIEIQGGEIGRDTDTYGIWSRDYDADIVISGGIIKGDFAALADDEGANITISAGEIRGGTYGISSLGIIDVTGGIIVASSGTEGIAIENSGTLKISGDAKISGGLYGIENNGKVTLDGGTIKGYYGILNNVSGEIDKLIVRGDTSISGTIYGINNYGAGTILLSGTPTISSISTSAVSSTSDIQITVDGEFAPVSPIKLHLSTYTNNYYVVSYSNSSYSSSWASDFYLADSSYALSLYKTLSGSCLRIQSSKVVNTTIGAGYTDLQPAIDGASSNDELEVLSNLTSTAAYTVNKTLTINAGSSNVSIAAPFEVQDGGNLSLSKITIDNYIKVNSGGRLTVTHGTTIEGGTYNGDVVGIYNDGTVSMTGGTIKGDYAVWNGSSSTSTAAFYMNYGTVQGNIYGLYNYAEYYSSTTIEEPKVVIRGGSISGGTGTSNAGIYNCYNGLISINTSEAPVTISGYYGVRNGATSSSNSRLSIVKLSYSLTITGTTYGVYNYADDAEITMTGGQISGGTSSSGQAGIYNSGNGTIDIQGGTISGHYGIQNGDNTSDTGKVTISGGKVTGESYGLYNCSDNSDALVVKNGMIYGSLAAIYNRGASIEIQGGEIGRDTDTYGIWSDTSGTTKITISGGIIKGSFSALSDDEGAEITIDGGQIIGGSYGIVSYGTITINDGTIQATGTEGVAIDNGDTLIVNDGAIQANKGTAIYNGYGTVEIIGGTITGYVAALSNNSNSTVTIAGGELNVDSGDYSVIENNSAGTILVSDGIIGATTLKFHGINNTGGGKVVVSGGTIQGGTISDYYRGAKAGIMNENGTIEISGGKISGYYGIYNESTSTSSITLSATSANAYTISGGEYDIYNFSTGRINVSGYLQGGSTGGDLTIYLNEVPDETTQAYIYLDNPQGDGIIRVFVQNWAEMAQETRTIFSTTQDMNTGGYLSYIWVGDNSEFGFWGKTYSSSTNRYYYQWMGCFDENTWVYYYDEKKKKIRRKRAKNVKFKDKLLVWNFDKGCFDFANPLFIQRTEYADEYTEIKFSDGSKLNIIADHAVFNAEDKYFRPIVSNERYGSPVGTKVMKYDGSIVTIVSKKTIHKKIAYTNIITKYHMNCFTNGILTSTPFNNMYRIDENMKYIPDESKRCHMLSLLDGIDKEYIEGLRLMEFPDRVLLNSPKNAGCKSFKEYIDKKLGQQKDSD